MTDMDLLLQNIRKCTICEDFLPNGVRPILQANSKAKILIAGQAPGRKVHRSGILFDDNSGNRLRDWMDITKKIFYDDEKIAILPMGFCYPGTGKHGDFPPRTKCEHTWRKQLMELLPNLELTLIIGKYAQAYHIKNSNLSLTELVKRWEIYWPTKIPLPHPSPRNNIWLKKNPWFKEIIIPKLRQRVSDIIKE